MTPYLADWLGIAFIFGALSFLAGWVACSISWKRWLRSIPPHVEVIDLTPKARAALDDWKKHGQVLRG